MLTRTFAIPFTSIALLASSVQAGGLYVPTFGTPSMGVASAGANAIADDASTAIQNPAGMTRLDDHALLGGLAPQSGLSRPIPRPGFQWTEALLIGPAKSPAFISYARWTPSIR